MISKYIFGKPFNTESVVWLPSEAKIFVDDASSFKYAQISVNKKDGFSFKMHVSSKTMIFGLGQSMGGIDKRGRIYNCWCTDEFSHTEEKTSLYGAHNFMVFYEPDSKNAFGLFFDYPGLIQIDAGFSSFDTVSVKIEDVHLNMYCIEGNSLLDITNQFRKMIGASYVPPLWSLGFMQSRWGYGSEEDLKKVYKNYK